MAASGKKSEREKLSSDWGWGLCDGYTKLGQPVLQKKNPEIMLDKVRK